MDHEVAQTLAALERKLLELERELTSIGREDPSPTSDPQPTMGALIDEAVDERFSMSVRETPYGEIPAAGEPRQTIDLAELVRFRETMKATLQGLIDEYSNLLSLKLPPSDS